MPAVTCENYRLLRVGVLDDIVSLLPDLRLDALSLAVELAQLARELFRADGIVGEQQFRGQFGAAQPCAATILCQRT